jgi:16S rRNA (guanine966-N2)-methyltransferase
VTRIVAGSAGGRRLASLVGAATRPTSDRVREALFSTLESMRGSLQGARFLDLYAGSGAVGLEALSRGASQAVLVEHDRRAAQTIRRNASTLGLLSADVVVSRVEHHLHRASPVPYDVVFIDPPYALPGQAVDTVVMVLLHRGWLGPDAVIALERSRRDEAPRWPGGLEQVQQRRYGDTLLWYGRRSVDPAADALGD